MRKLLCVSFLVTYLVVAPYQSAFSADGFCFASPGQLTPKESGIGRLDDRWVYLRDITFPLKVGKTTGDAAYVNSQIFGVGGSFGSSGNVNDVKNYKYCWSDTFCEGKRAWKMPLCPAGIGHQGLDIRPSAPTDNYYEAVAFADGVITLITENTTVTVRADDGTECRYLHLHPASLQDLSIGQRVKRAETVIGRVSNYMGGRPNTSIHLHFDCKQRLKIGTRIVEVHVPTYSSVILPYAMAWGDKIGVVNNELEAGTVYEIEGK
jgi:murein DD-endopeptidase MepM/ murein hydrolase activator NlpD